MATKPLNIRTVSSAVTNIAQYVQDKKIALSRSTIRKARMSGKWPDEHLSYVSAESGRNEFKDPERFYRVMAGKPQWYARKFIFRPKVDTSHRIREATIAAHRIAIKQSRQYGYQTGHYASSFTVMLNRTPLANLAQLDGLTADDTTQIVNIAAYAGTVEKNALYFSKIGGVLYYAARRIQKLYPELAVRFVYSRANTIPGTYSKYDVPTLAIGVRGKVQPKLTRPGKQHRRRNRGSQR